MHFFNSVLQEALIPTYRILDGNGKVLEDAVLPEVRSIPILVNFGCSFQIHRGR